MCLAGLTITVDDWIFVALTSHVTAANSAEVAQSSSPPIFPPVEPGDLSWFHRVYLSQIREACRGYLRSVAAIDDRAAGAGAVADIWDAVELTLARATRVANFLFSSKKAGAANRAASLRSALGIEGDRLSELRRVRNHFEHLDERMDAWWKSDPTHSIADSNIGSGTSLVGGMTLARHYDPQIHEVSAFGDSIYLEKVTLEIVEVLQAIERWERNRKA